MKEIAMIAVVLCACASSFGAISYVGGTLAYSSPADLDTVIDPAGLNDVQQSFGVTEAAFQAMIPQVVGFNGAPAPTQTLQQLVVSNSATSTLTFTFPAAMYNYGAPTSKGRGAFSGTSLQDAISTLPTLADDGVSYNWFDAKISSTPGQGPTALGFCVAFRNDQTVAAGTALFTLSDGSTASVSLPKLGSTTEPQYIFLGYQAPAGLTITRVQASQTAVPGGGYVTIDDLSFVAVPEPATLALLATGSLVALRRRRP